MFSQRIVSYYLPRSAIEFIQPPGIRNPKPARVIFTTQYDDVAADARKIV
jgi:hypothetical protein